MTDNALIILIRSILVAGLTDQGRTGIAVKQSFQPTQQGAESGPAVYLHKVSDRRRGSPARKSRWDAATSAMIHTETTWYETTFQVNAQAIQNPADTASLTASDLVNASAAAMQSQSCLDTLKAQGVGILAVTEIRNPRFTDERGRFEADPSFDFTVTHKQVITSTTPVVETVTHRIERV